MSRILFAAQLDGIAHEQTIICRQLFPGHVVGSRPNEKKEKFALNDNADCFHSGGIVKRHQTVQNSVYTVLTLFQKSIHQNTVQ